MGHKAGTLTTHTAGQVGQFIIGGWVNFGPVVTLGGIGPVSVSVLFGVMPTSLL